MTAKKTTDLDDIAVAIDDLATLVDKRFGEVDKRFSKVDQRFDGIEKSIADIQKDQREVKEWLVRIDNRLLGMESDIEEIYDRIVALKEKGESLTSSDKKELERQLKALFAWAKEVSRQTGISLPKL